MSAIGPADPTARAVTPPAGCDRCLGRSWLLGRLAAHLEHFRARIHAVLALPDAELITSVAGPEAAAVIHEQSELDVGSVRARAGESGLEPLCRCDPRYPSRLLDLAAPPATLYVAGGVDRMLAMAAAAPVAVVGARRASPYGLEVARSLARSLARSGVPVVSGMALGIDAAAHAGALSAAEDGGDDRPAVTFAILPGSAAQPYPSSKRALHRRILAAGAALSELPPGTEVRRWMFPARNRIIAALGEMTVVVEAGTRSGSLVTAGIAAGLGRPVGAVPGRITTPQARGANGLIAAGACVVRDAQDVLDALYGAGVRQAASERRAPIEPAASSLLRALAAGEDTAAALDQAGLAAEDGLAVLAELELGGHLRRGPGGRWLVMP